MKIGELSLQQIKELCDKYDNYCFACPLDKCCKQLNTLGTDFDDVTCQLSGYLDEEVDV